MRAAIDQHTFCPAFINKIEDEPVLVRNPETTKSFQEAAKAQGFFNAG